MTGIEEEHLGIHHWLLQSDARDHCCCGLSWFRHWSPDEFVDLRSLFCCFLSLRIFIQSELWRLQPCEYHLNRWPPLPSSQKNPSVFPRKKLRPFVNVLSSFFVLWIHCAAANSGNTSGSRATDSWLLCNLAVFVGSFSYTTTYSEQCTTLVQYSHMIAVNLANSERISVCSSWFW